MEIINNTVSRAPADVKDVLSLSKTLSEAIEIGILRLEFLLRPNGEGGYSNDDGTCGVDVEDCRCVVWTVLPSLTKMDLDQSLVDNYNYQLVWSSYLNHAELRTYLGGLIPLTVENIAKALESQRDAKSQIEGRKSWT
jgi:hypothetical protein